MGLHIAKKWLYLAGGALLIGNGLAIWQTREWGIDNFIALVLGNLCMLTAFIYLAFLYRTSQRISGWDEAKIHSTFRKTTILLGLAMLIVPFFSSLFECHFRRMIGISLLFSEIRVFCMVEPSTICQ